MTSSGTIDLTQDVTYYPLAAWNQSAETACSSDVLYSTDVIGASASLSFRGDSIQILGGERESDGLLQISVDNETTLVDLSSGQGACTTLFNWTGTTGAHNLNLSLLPPSNFSTYSQSSSLSISHIKYFNSDAPLSHAGRGLHPGVIIAIVLGCFAISFCALGLRCFLVYRRPDADARAWVDDTEKCSPNSIGDVVDLAASLSRTSSMTMVGGISKPPLPEGGQRVSGTRAGAGGLNFPAGFYPLIL
ncbi:hypothetical protein EUX98_g6207 [Antrodiella citrinella]|uniref:Uncharacterized protein n=1 Tax=Antrodiella citrinella TaxID=2447956 RepID=A0A4V3XI59_9APHY|nr:hypothetical protein EUX98_g6207 [Antrodiella citrinella]